MGREQCAARGIIFVLDISGTTDSTPWVPPTETTPWNPDTPSTPPTTPTQDNGQTTEAVSNKRKCVH